MSTPPKAATHTAPDARRTTADALIAAADLPTPVAERVAAIVRATRLWKSERADIARELIAHAQDALAAGRTPEDTADSLGDPTTVARLLRRSAKRKRHWLWQARQRTLQAIGLCLLAIVGFYTVLFVRFNTGSPSITRNYIAELNERNNTYPEDQKALPAYEALHRAWSPLYQQLYRVDAEYRQAENIDDPNNITAFEHFPYSPPDAPLYDRLLTAYTTVRPQLDAALAASRLPTLGILYSDRYEEVTNEYGATELKMLPPTEDPALSGNLIEILLPWLGHARNNTTLIAFDAVLAARDNNPDRAAESLTAIFNTARLIGQEHTLIASLVAIAVQSEGENVLLQILHNHPDLLSGSRLTAIAHTAAVSGRTARDLDFATERRTFGDFLQRAYTDDRHGDGRLTAQGLHLARLMNGLSSDGYDDLAHNDILPMRFIGPVTMLTYGSRRDQQDVHARMMDLAESLLAAEPGSAESARLHEDAAKLEAQLDSGPRYTMAAILTPAFTRAVDSAHRARAHTDATLTTIALHIHHQRTGRWPDALADLTPNLLPSIPADPFDPGRPIKYRLIDGVPHVYFTGRNGQDNHAQRAEPKHVPTISSLSGHLTRGPSTAPEYQADWIIFPPDAP